MSQGFAKKPPAQAPRDPTFITQTPNGILTNEQAMSTLATGYVKNTTTTGVQSVQAVPIPIADGGTGNTSAYTAGSILFSDGTAVTQDNANLFWDDTGNLLLLGGTTAAGADIILNADGSAIFNEQGNAVNFRVEGSGGATNLLVVDGTNNRVDIGTATQGAIAKFGTSEIVFNETGLGTLDFRVESFGNANMLFVDASADKIGLKTNLPHSTLDIRGGISLDAHTVASGGSETLDGNDYCVFSAPAALATTTITLPLASTAGRVYYIKKTNAAGAGTVRITPDGAETIDGVSGNLDMAGAFSSRTIISDGTGWLIISST